MLYRFPQENHMEMIFWGGPHVVIVGIDPGRDGAIVALRASTGEILETHRMPRELAEYAAIMRRLQPHLHGTCGVWLERGQSMPRKGGYENGVQMFSYGKHCGLLEGVLLGLAIPYRLVPPVTWVAAVVGLSKAALAEHPDGPKARSAKAAKALWPVKALCLPRGRVPHEGIVDAALIAEFGRRKLKQQIA